MAEAVLEALLEVQAHDLVADQLRYRRQSLPERASLRARETALVELEQAVTGVNQRVHDLERAQRRLEAEIDSIRSRVADSEGRLYSGEVQAPRELQALSQEVEALRRRQRQLEDDLLEVMEAAEAETAEQARLHGERERAEAEATQLRARIRDQEAELDSQLGVENSGRAHAAASVPADLLASYERLRDRLGGIGVARIDGGRCTGCHLSLPAVELDALRRSSGGAVVLHEECGRILVP